MAKGADVFATVNTAETAAFLASQTDIPSSHIFASQDSVVNLRGAARASQKGGFDVILSTAAIDLELLYVTPKILQPLGHLIHVGRIEGASAQAVGGLDMDLLSQKNATFSPVDLAILLDSTPVLGGQLLQVVGEYFRQGSVKPARLFGGATTDATDLPHVLADFHKSKSDAGKLVVTFANPKSDVKMAQPLATVRFNPDACYVITGALGVLGQSIVRWMVDRGARH